MFIVRILANICHDIRWFEASILRLSSPFRKRPTPALGPLALTMLSFGTIFFLGYVLFAVLLIYTLLFGESEFHRRGYVGTKLVFGDCPIPVPFSIKTYFLLVIAIKGACHRFITSGLWVQVKYVPIKWEFCDGRDRHLCFFFYTDQLAYFGVIPRRLGPKLCGKAMFGKCASCSDWLWNKPNPVMQVRFHPFLG